MSERLDTWWQSDKECVDCHQAKFYSNGRVYVCPNCESKYEITKIRPDDDED